MKYNFEEFLENCKFVFNNFLKNDYLLIENKNYEPTVSGRMAMYFRDRLDYLEKKNLFVDVEYNKYGQNKKLARCEQNECSYNKPIRPDIIIHERTKQEKNLLYCELKKNASRNSEDKNKVEEQVKDKKYTFGLYINRIKEKEIQFQVFNNNVWRLYIYFLDDNSIKEITNE